MHSTGDTWMTVASTARRLLDDRTYAMMWRCSFTKHWSTTGVVQQEEDPSTTPERGGQTNMSIRHISKIKPISLKLIKFKIGICIYGCLLYVFITRNGFD